jgi:hypothetical protein
LHRPKHRSVEQKYVAVAKDISGNTELNTASNTQLTYTDIIKYK